MQELKEKLGGAESLLGDYKEENAVLKAELRDAQETLSKGTTKDSKKLNHKLKVPCPSPHPGREESVGGVWRRRRAWRTSCWRRTSG